MGSDMELYGNPFFLLINPMDLRYNRSIDLRFACGNLPLTVCQ